jgi:hypothetical protein
MDISIFNYKVLLRLLNLIRQPNVVYEPQIKLSRSFELSVTLRNTYYITQSTGLTKLNNPILSNTRFSKHVMQCNKNNIHLYTMWYILPYDTVQRRTRVNVVMNIRFP